MAGTVSAIDLYWLPLGAGGHSVQLNGRVFEAVVARLERRTACDLYHSALVVRAPSGRFVIEQAPIRDNDGAKRGVVAEGAVGSRLAGRFRIFRYEVRRWRDGVIPDVAEAVASPQLLTDDPGQAQRLLDLVPQAPTPVWGRDELDAGEMWNSNSLTSWLLVRSGLDIDTIQPPAGGRAPGWDAGLVVARRQKSERTLYAATSGALVFAPPASCVLRRRSSAEILARSTLAAASARLRSPCLTRTHRNGRRFTP
jgi:hypothetical protein